MEVSFVDVISIYLLPEVERDQLLGIVGIGPVVMLVMVMDVVIVDLDVATVVD